MAVAIGSWLQQGSALNLGVWRRVAVATPCRSGDFFVLYLWLADFPTTNSIVTVQATIWILQLELVAFGCGLWHIQLLDCRFGSLGCFSLNMVVCCGES
jgi:hypothetical protein